MALGKLKLCLLCLVFLSGCDPLRKKKCEWYLTPNPDADEITPEGLVSLCVSNYELGRKRCHFTGEFDFVQKFNGIPFRYSEMKYTDTFPKQIIGLNKCKPEVGRG